MTNDLIGFSAPSVRMRPKLPQTSTCTQTGQPNFTSTIKASGTSRKPRKKIKNTAGPSALSLRLKSNPHWSHFSFKSNFRKPSWKILPWWHFGHVQNNAILSRLKMALLAFLSCDDINVPPRPFWQPLPMQMHRPCRLYCPTSKWQQTGTTKQHQQSASTKQPLQSRNGALW